LGPALARIGVFLTIMLYSPSLNSGEGEMIRRERERERAANQASSQTLPKDPLQLPGQQGQNPAPAVDPTSGEVLYTPAGQDYTPAVDPVTGVPLQAPANRSYGPIEASKRKGTWDPDEGEWRPPGKEHHTRGGLGRSSQKPGGQNIKELEDAVTNSNRLKLTKKGRIALSDLLHGNKRAGDLGSEEDPYKAGDRTFGELEKLGEEFEELYPRGEYPEYYR
jgi:hypothetical protein